MLQTVSTNEPTHYTKSAHNINWHQHNTRVVMLQTISTKEPTTNLHPASSDINITENTRAAYPFCRLLSFLFLLFRHMVRMCFRCSSKLAQLKQWEINKVVFTIFCGLINSEALHFGRKRCNICNSFSWTRIFKQSNYKPKNLGHLEKWNTRNQILELSRHTRVFIWHFTIITQETPDTNYMKSTTARKVFGSR